MAWFDANDYYLMESTMRRTDPPSGDDAAEPDVEDVELGQRDDGRGREADEPVCVLVLRPDRPRRIDRVIDYFGDAA